MLVSQIPALRDYWYPISYSSELTTEPRKFRIFGEQCVAWRVEVGGHAAAAYDTCPHRAAKLSQGWVADGCLVCPYHGWRFDEAGQCVEIPSAEPGTPVPPKAKLRSVPCEERYGLVWVCIGEPVAAIPDLPEALDPSYTLVHEMMEEWAASAPRIVDNALDVSHVAWVHRNSVGSAADPRLSDFTVERRGINLTFKVSYITRLDDQQKANTGLTSDFTTRTTLAELVQPLVFRGVLEYVDNGLIHVLYKTATPVDDHHTLFCQFVARNDAPDADKQAGIIAVDRRVQDEDRVLLENIDPDFPTDVTAEVHVRADRMTIEYRRILGELAAGPRPFEAVA